MKFIAKIILVLAIIFSGFAQAQSVDYEVVDAAGKKMGIATFVYSGDENVKAYRNGELVASFTVRHINEKQSVTIIVDEERTIYIHLADNKYWHDRVGQQRNSIISTSRGETGIHQLYYHGWVSEIHRGKVITGRKYRSEIYLNGRLFGSGISIIDKNNRPLWSEGVDQDGLTISFISY